MPICFLLLMFASPILLSANPQPEKQRYGLLKLDIDPSGTAMIMNGKYLDHDVWLISIKPGKHHVAIMKKGFKPFFKEFEIKGGAKITLNVKLAAVDSLVQNNDEPK